jgi:putative phosphotransacetylase
MQPGQYAAEETVSLIGPKGRIDGVRVLCPMRGQTQVELSKTDTFRLGIPACMRQSGDLAGSPGLILESTDGRRVELSEGAIVALRHLHLDKKTAAEYSILDKQMVSAEQTGSRPIVMHQVFARVSKDFVPELHIDMDEANACDLSTGDFVSILK